MRKVVGVLILLLSVLPLGSAHATDVHSILVVVNGEVITGYDFSLRWRFIEDKIYKDFGDRMYEPELQKQIVELKDQLKEQMIDEIILRQESMRLGIKVSDDEITKYIDRIREENNLDEQGYVDFLAGMGIDEEHFRTNIRDDLIKQRIMRKQVASRIVVTDAEIKEAYQKEMGNTSLSGRAVKVSVIMVDDEDAMDTVLDAIDDGMSFAEAADEYSVGPGVGVGGDMGLLGWGELAEEWQVALDGLEAGEVSEPALINGLQTLLMIKEESVKEFTLSDSDRQRVERVLRDEKFDALFKDFMETQRERTVIEYK